MIIEVHNMNAGQGYATFIYTKSNNKEELYLIDAGKEPSLFTIIGTTTSTALKSQNYSFPDGIVNTTTD